jgi:hypothetical protein
LEEGLAAGGLGVVQAGPVLRKAAVTSFVQQQGVQVSSPIEVERTVTETTAEVVSKATKKAEKVLCYRCGNNGHMADACKAVLCIYCERATHEAKACHLLKMPKPTASIFG